MNGTSEPGTFGPVIAFIPRGFLGTTVMDEVVDDLERRARVACNASRITGSK